MTNSPNLRKYKLLIKIRRDNKINSGHTHHIVPRCIDTQKKYRNLTVVLTLEEHTMAHYYLMKHFKKMKSQKAYIYMRAAFIGLRNQWFHTRWKCQVEKEFIRFARNFERSIGLKYNS